MAEKQVPSSSAKTPLSPNAPQPPASKAAKTLPGEDAAPAAKAPEVIPVPTSLAGQSYRGVVPESSDSDDSMSEDKIAEGPHRAFEEAMARLKKMEMAQAELVASEYKNCIRLTKKGPSKLGEWHQSHVQRIITELKKGQAQGVVLWKDYRFVLEITFQSMSGPDAKANLDWVRQLLNRTQMTPHFSMVPPYSPDTNIMTGPAATFLKCMMVEAEAQLGVPGNQIPKECKPSITYPVQDSQLCMWSVELNERTIAHGTYKGGVMELLAHDSVTARQQNFSMHPVVEDFRLRYNAPWVLRTATTDARQFLQRAPLRGKGKGKGDTKGDKGKGKGKGSQGSQGSTSSAQ